MIHYVCKSCCRYLIALSIRYLKQRRKTAIEKFKCVVMAPCVDFEMAWSRGNKIVNSRGVNRKRVLHIRVERSSPLNRKSPPKHSITTIEHVGQTYSLSHSIYVKHETRYRTLPAGLLVKVRMFYGFGVILKVFLLYTGKESQVRVNDIIN